MRLSISRPMTGCSMKEVVDYYNYTKDVFTDFGYDVLIPIYGKQFLEGEEVLRASGYEQPLSKDHAIVLRDRWMIKNSQISLFDFSNSKIVSIGSMFELAWAFSNGNQTIVVMEKGNIHDHAFVKETAHVLYESLDEAIDYLGKLIKKSV